MVRPSAAPPVYISVLNWNGADKTLACLQSLTALDYPNYHIIVVDNASADDSVARIQAAFPAVTLLVAPENLGYAGGNEVALHHAQAIDSGPGLFWILNNDATVRPDTLTHLVNAYHTHGDAVYGGVTIDTDTAPDDWRVTTLVWHNHAFKPIHSQPYAQLYPTTTPRPVAFVGGSNFMIPLALVRQHGFIDTSFFMYVEDIDYCFRLRRAGINSIEVPTAIIFHAGGASHKSISKDFLQPIITYYRARNRIVFWWRHAGWFRTLQAVATQLMFALGWAALYFRRGIIGLRCARFALLGIRDALRGRMGKVYAPEDYLGQ